jgi:hypothetical protein
VNENRDKEGKRIEIKATWGNAIYKARRDMKYKEIWEYVI